MQIRKMGALIIVLIVFALVMVGCAGKQVEQPEEDTRIPVMTETVKKDAMEKVIKLGGLFQPQDEVFLSAKNPAFRISDVPVQVGDEVSAGTPLVIFDSRDLQLQLEQAQLNYQRSKELFEAGGVSKSQLEQAEYALENLEIQQENMFLTCPLRGIVAKVDAVEGQLAGSMPLVSVVNIDKLKLKVQVGEANISKIKVGGEMTVSVPAVAGEYSGVVTSVAPQVDAASKAYPVILEMENKDMTLRGGMYGEVRLVVESKQDVVVVPQQAIIDQGQKKVVFVVENDSARMKEVEIGLTLGDKAEIIQGLQPGAQLIVEGQYAVQDGSLVTTAARGDE